MKKLLMILVCVFMALPCFGFEYSREKLKHDPQEEEYATSRMLARFFFSEIGIEKIEKNIRMDCGILATREGPPCGFCCDVVLPKTTERHKWVMEESEFWGYVKKYMKKNGIPKHAECSFVYGGHGVKFFWVESPMSGFEFDFSASKK